MFIGMSRICFELGHLDKAIKYNEQARAIAPHGRETLLNDAWFAAINNNLPRFCEKYSKLVMKGLIKSQNYVDIVEFIARHKPNYPEAKKLFDFMEGYINFASQINVELGEKILRNLQSEIVEEVNYKCLNELIGRVFQIHSRISSNVQVQKRKRSKSKKKRR